MNIDRLGSVMEYEVLRFVFGFFGFEIKSYDRFFANFKSYGPYLFSTGLMGYLVFPNKLLSRRGGLPMYRGA